MSPSGRKPNVRKGIRMGVRRDCWWQICSLRRSFDCGEEIPFW